MVSGRGVTLLDGTLVRIGILEAVGGHPDDTGRAGSDSRSVRFRPDEPLVVRMLLLLLDEVWMRTGQWACHHQIFIKMSRAWALDRSCVGGCWRMLLLLLLLDWRMLLDAAGWLCDGHKDVVSQSDGDWTAEHPRASGGEIRGATASGMNSGSDSGSRSG